RHELDVFDERRQVAVQQAAEVQVHQELIHRGIADALADPERAAVYAVRDRRGDKGVDHTEAAFVVPVIVELHRRLGRGDHVLTLRSISSMRQSSAKRRIGLEPMKAHVSIGTPASTLASIAPCTSAGCVRTAQLGLSFRSLVVSLASTTIATRACDDAPGRPM